MVNFEHVSFSFFARITENALKNHCHVGHKIYRVIVNNHLPRHVEILARFGLRFGGWITDGGLIADDVGEMNKRLR